MTALSFKDIYLRFAGVPILNKITGSIERGERVGLVGPNGAGKTTFLRIITGEEHAEGGEVRKPNSLRVGYLPQGGVEGGPLSCLEEALAATGDLTDIGDEIRALTREMSEIPPGEPVPKALLARYGELEHQFSHRGGYEGESAVLKVLDGLGIGREHWQKTTAQLSGGMRMRVALAKLVLKDHDLLLMDEPTNHLDIVAIEWLEEYLANSSQAQIIVSHDRRFLDRLVSEIWELEHGSLYVYRGDYSGYLEGREERRAHQRKRRELMLEERKKLQDFIARNRVRKDRAKIVQGRIKQLKKLEEIPLPPETPESTFRLSEAPPGDRVTVKMEGVGKSFGKNPVFRGLDLVIERGDRVAVVGPNGSGKSTLLRVLTGREEVTEGSFWFSKRNVVRSYSQDEAESLKGSETVLREVERVSSAEMVPQARSLLARFLFCGDDVFKPLNALSGGERSRLALAKLMVEPVNFLVLDEPTNHLDQDGQAVLTSALESYTGTLVFVSHDRYFVDRIAHRIVEVDSRSARCFLGNYSEYRAKLNDDAEREPPPPTFEPRGAVVDHRVKPADRPPKGSRELDKERKGIEHEIETIEARLGALETMLGSPAVFRSGDLSREIVEERKALREKLVDLYACWEKLTEG